MKTEEKCLIPGNVPIILMLDKSLWNQLRKKCVGLSAGNTGSTITYRWQESVSAEQSESQSGWVPEQQDCLGTVDLAPDPDQVDRHQQHHEILEEDPERLIHRTAHDHDQLLRDPPDVHALRIEILDRIRIVRRRGCGNDGREVDWNGFLDTSGIVRRFHWLDGTGGICVRDRFVHGSGSVEAGVADIIRFVKMTSDFLTSVSGIWTPIPEVVPRFFVSVQNQTARLDPIQSMFFVRLTTIWI